MYRKNPGLLMLPLLLGSVLTLPSKATTSPQSNLYPKRNGGEGLEFYAPRLKFYAETKDLYINICRNDQVSEYYYVSKLIQIFGQHLNKLFPNLDIELSVKTVVELV